MEPYFKDEVHVALLSSVERRPNAPSQRPAPLLPTDRNDAYSSPSSSPTSSSHTVLGFDSPPQSYDDAFTRDRQHWFKAYDSSETGVANFISTTFPSLKNKFPAVLGTSEYKRIASDDLRHKSRRVASRKKAICLLLLAALLLGAGGRSIRNAVRRAEQAHFDERFHPSLYDEDSLQDASITVPTLPRPDHPSAPEDILPVHLHHDVSEILPPSAPSPSAANRRQLNTIPSQAHLFDKKQCLDAWITEGVVCDDLDGYFRDQPELAGIDVLYTWVNGSDWRHMAAKWMHGYRSRGRWQEYVEEDLFPMSSASRNVQNEPATSTLRRRAAIGSGNRGSIGSIGSSRASWKGNVPAQNQNRFRDHEELRFSMRSAAKHLHGLSSIHIVAPDFSAPYHLQPGAKQQPEPKPTKLRNLVDKSTSIIRRRATRPSFNLNIDKLKEGFLGLPSQLRRVQGLGTDRFTTDEGQIREGQVPQWLYASPNSSVLAGQAATRDKAASTSFSESLLRVFSSHSSSSLDTTSPLVRLHHDWNSFTNNWLISKPSTVEKFQTRNDYRKAALPTFNSMAAESMLGDEPGLHDNFVYSNDDFFFTDDVTTGDFNSPFFGPVMRIDYNLVVAGQRSPASSDGEWSSLWHTNWLLDQRFGKRNRPYIQHVQKSMSRTLLQEARIGWAHEHARLGQNRFRNGGDNIVTHFLAYYNIVERHREALLWTFFMLRLDEDGDGLVSKEELLSALTQMGLTPEQIVSAYPEYRQSNANETLTQRNLTVAVHLPKRKALAQDNYNAALVKAGWPVPLKSQITFTSHDGFPLGELARKVIFPRDENEGRKDGRAPKIRPSTNSPTRGSSSYYGWPDFVDDRAARPTDDAYNQRFERPACELKLEQCLYQPFSQMTAGQVEWEKVFKFFTYTRVQCGDCLIHHLVGQSGERGLSAFLPTADRKYMGATESDARFNSGVPHLPLSSVWNEQTRMVDAVYETERPCFTVACVLANSGYGKGTALRTFASKLIQRYSYSFAETPLQFNRLETQYTSTKTLREVGSLMQKPSSLELFEHKKKDGEVAGAWLASQQNVDLHRPALVCINDDITPRWVDVVGKLFKTWLSENWPEKQPWEL